MRKKGNCVSVFCHIRNKKAKKLDKQSATQDHRSDAIQNDNKSSIHVWWTRYVNY